LGRLAGLIVSRKTLAVRDPSSYARDSLNREQRSPFRTRRPTRGTHCVTNDARRPGLVVRRAACTVSRITHVVRHAIRREGYPTAGDEAKFETTGCPPRAKAARPGAFLMRGLRLLKRALESPTLGHANPEIRAPGKGGRYEDRRPGRLAGLFVSRKTLAVPDSSSDARDSLNHEQRSPSGSRHGKRVNGETGNLLFAINLADGCGKAAAANSPQIVAPDRFR